MKETTVRYLALTILLTSFLAPKVLATPGETSGSPLAPLLVTDYDAATGNLSLVYQNGCDTSDNTIYYGALDQVSNLAYSGQVCDIGTKGSYGRSLVAGAPFERAPHAGNTCGVSQNLAAACTPTSAGATCASSVDCGARNTCIVVGTGASECGCLEPFAGAYCETCATGYAGPDCRECAPGFAKNEMRNSDGGDFPIDRTAPEMFRCVPDLPGDCTGRTCGGRGTCVVAGREALCACDGSGSSHNGSLPGTRSWLWQLGGLRTNNVPLPWWAWKADPMAPWSSTSVRIAGPRASVAWAVRATRRSTAASSISSAMPLARSTPKVGRSSPSRPLSFSPRAFVEA